MSGTSKGFKVIRNVIEQPELYERDMTAKEVAAIAVAGIIILEEFFLNFERIATAMEKRNAVEQK